MGFTYRQYKLKTVKSNISIKRHTSCVENNYIRTTYVSYFQSILRYGIVFVWYLLQDKLNFNFTKESNNAY